VIQKLANFKQIRFLLGEKPTSQKTTPAVEQKEGALRRLRFGKKSKILVGFTLIIVMLVSIFAFLPRENQAAPPQNKDVPIAAPPSSTPNPTTTSTPSNPLAGIQQIITDINNVITPKKEPGVLESAQTINSSVWQKIASIAWKYYQPGVGVDRNTGLPWSGTGSQYFTDWDVGIYIQAAVDASKLNLVDNSSDWGFEARINKVLTFLETRELNDASYPFWFYQAKDKGVWHENSDKVPGDHIDLADTGRLFVALNNLRNYDINFTSRVNNIVLYGQLHNRSNYAELIPVINAESMSSVSIYSYYIASGFASFWPTQLAGAPGHVLDNIFSSGNVSIDGVLLPKSKISGDPLLCSVFELNNNDHRLMSLMNLTYSAHEAYYNNSVGKYRAFGEGPNYSSDWQWEWVVLPDNRTWTTLNSKNEEVGSPPVIYTKIAFGFLAIYNTSYTQNMCIYLEHNMQDPTSGYRYGIDEFNSPLNEFGSSTNGLILGAAVYATQNNL